MENSAVTGALADNYSPLELLLMLYDGAIDFLKKSQQAAINEKYEEAALLNQKVIDIFLELDSSLDTSLGEIPLKLKQLYDFYRRQLILANLKKDPQLLDPIITFLEDYRTLWQSIPSTVKQAK